ncbi:MAG: alpha/beta hydrolase [Roseiflexaceae bacterium]
MGELHPLQLDAVVQDVTDAIQYVRAHAADLHVDPDRLCLWAGSAGAVAGLRVGLADPQPFIRCLVTYYGLCDLALYAQARNLPPPAPEVLQAFAPVTYLRQYPQQIPPLFIARMEHDIPGLNVAVDELVAVAAAAQAPVELVNHPDGHHGFDTEDDNEQSRMIIQQTLAFMHRHLFAPTIDDRR